MRKTNNQIILAVGAVNRHTVRRVGYLKRCAKTVAFFSEFTGRGQSGDVVKQFQKLDLKSFPRSNAGKSFLFRQVSIFFYLHKIRKEIRMVNPDIIHVFYPRMFFVWCVLALTEKPVFVTVMGSDIFFKVTRISYVDKQLTLSVLRQASYVTSKSLKITERLVALGVDEQKILDLPWGVDTSHFRFLENERQSYRENLAIPKEAKVILSSRAISRLYNIDKIIHAFYQVYQQNLNVYLLICLSGAESDYLFELQNIVLKLQLGKRVVFLPEMSYDDMPKVYSIADVLVSIPSQDGLPQTIIEAMACDLPCIVGRLDAFKGVFFHKKDVYYTDITENALASAILEIISSSELERQLKDGGQNVLQKAMTLENNLVSLQKQYDSAHLKKRPFIFARAKILLMLVFYPLLNKVSKILENWR